MWDIAAAGVLKVMLRDIEMKREKGGKGERRMKRERENGKNVVWNDVTGMRLFDLYEPLKLDGAVNYIVSVMHTHTHTQWAKQWLSISYSHWFNCRVFVGLIVNPLCYFKFSVLFAFIIRHFMLYSYYYALAWAVLSLPISNGLWNAFTLCFFALHSHSLSLYLHANSLYFILIVFIRYFHVCFFVFSGYYCHHLSFCSIIVSIVYNCHCSCWRHC